MTFWEAKQLTILFHLPEIQFYNEQLTSTKKFNTATEHSTLDFQSTLGHGSSLQLRGYYSPVPATRLRSRVGLGYSSGTGSERKCGTPGCRCCCSWWGFNPITGRELRYILHFFKNRYSIKFKHIISYWQALKTIRQRELHCGGAEAVSWLRKCKRDSSNAFLIVSVSGH